MREFNTTGPCDPSRHYTVIREPLLDVGRAMVRQGKFFTLFAPRQTGKTTYFQLLIERLRTEGYTAIWISFEDFKTIDKAVFYQELTLELSHQLKKLGIEIEHVIENSVTLRGFFSYRHGYQQPVVLVIDEFEGIPDDVLSEVMHTFRQIYHKKHHFNLHSLILVGVSTIAKLVVGPASPFNIAHQLELDYFSRAEVDDLIQQYVSESGQPFEAAVIETIYENTQGQPGLVCALCEHLVTRVVTDRTQPVTMADFYPTLTYFLRQKWDKNIVNIVQKAQERRAFMLKLLFGGEPIPFTVDNADIAWLYANGVVALMDGYVGLPVPLYAKRIINAFRPLINGESEHYVTSARNVLGDYLTDDGERLNLNALLNAYRAYVQRRGFQAFDIEGLREGAWHYSLDGYLNFFIERLGGQTFVEVPVGAGRTDILIRYREQSYIIELKLYTDDTYFKQGKGQLAEYLKAEGLAEGYYVVFSKAHTESDALFTAEEIAGKRIYTHIIRTQFERPSDAPVPDELKERKK